MAIALLISCMHLELFRIKKAVNEVKPMGFHELLALLKKISWPDVLTLTLLRLAMFVFGSSS